MDPYIILKDRYSEYRIALPSCPTKAQLMTHEVQMWHHVYTKPALYSEIPLVLHVTLCCFVKVPLEATAETIGSVVNQNGRKFMYSLHPSSLSNEVQVAWNRPAEFSRATDEKIKTTL